MLGDAPEDGGPVEAFPEISDAVRVCFGWHIPTHLLDTLFDSRIKPKKAGHGDSSRATERAEAGSRGGRVHRF